MRAPGTNIILNTTVLSALHSNQASSTPLHRVMLRTMAQKLNIRSTLKLNSGYEIPRLGFGVSAPTE